MTSERRGKDSTRRGHDHADQRLVLERAQSIVRDEFGFFFSTIQIETECEEEDLAAAIDLANTDRREGTDTTGDLHRGHTA